MPLSKLKSYLENIEEFLLNIYERVYSIIYNTYDQFNLKYNNVLLLNNVSISYILSYITNNIIKIDTVIINRVYNEIHFNNVHTLLYNVNFVDSFKI